MRKSIIIILGIIIPGIIFFFALSCNDDPVSPPNANQWIPRESGTTEHLCDVTWNGSKFIISGWDIILSSTNGVNWTKEEFPPEFVADGKVLSEAVWSETRHLFLLAGDNIIMTSPDGSAWTMRESGLEWGFIGSAAVFDTLFLISYQNPITLLTSGDGITWTAHPDIGPFEKMAASDTLLIGVGGGEIYSSVNGIDWILRHSVDSLIYCITWFQNKSLWVAAGHLGAFWKSSNGIDWTSFDAGAGEFSSLLDAVSFGSNCTIVGHANGPGLILNSTDGESWSKTIIDSVGWLNGLAASPVQTVVVGENGVILTKP
jgi:hypothetical protein